MKSPRRGEFRRASPATHHVVWCFAGIVNGLLFTGVGIALARLQGSVDQFLREWMRLQGFFMFALGTWLFLIIRSGALQVRLKALVEDAAPSSGIFANRSVRVALLLFIGVVGTVSVSKMGFNAEGPLLVFMWLMCAGVCSVAGIVTLHALEATIAIHHLQTRRIRVFKYSPARTPELRSLVSYFSSFTLLMSTGYAFSVAATMLGHWRGEPHYVDVVRWSWPIIYVPLCTVVLFCPHLVVHRLIEREKERTLLSCQRDIDDLLSKYSDLKTEDIERANTLAQLFDRIAATPSYVVDVGIAARTLIPVGVNIVSLVAKTALKQP